MRKGKLVSENGRNDIQWGICLDVEACGSKLFQTVVQYAADTSNDKVTILSPSVDCQVNKTDIIELQESLNMFMERMFLLIITLISQELWYISAGILRETVVFIK